MFVMGCFGPLVAVYVRDTLHASTKTFGVTSAMIGLGLLCGVNVLNTLGKKMRNTLQVYLGLGGIALGTGLMAFVPVSYTHLPRIRLLDRLTLLVEAGPRLRRHRLVE